MMRFRQQLWKAALALLGAAGAAGAQTSDEWQGRYGPPLRAEHVRRPGLWASYGAPLSETFVVRPDISLTVTYTADGEACRAELRPYSSTPAELPPPDVVSAEEVSKIIGEFTPRAAAPAEGPGRQPQSVSFHSGCNAVVVERFEGFEVTRAVRAEQCGGGGVYSAVVVWRGAGRRCAAPRGGLPPAPKPLTCWGAPPQEVERRWL